MHYFQNYNRKTGDNYEQIAGPRPGLVADDLKWIESDYILPADREILTQSYINFINKRYKEIKKRFLEAIV